MEYLIIIIKIGIALSIINVWLFRINKSTSWRGNNASSMKEEFKSYGLPEWLMYVVGSLKLLFSLGLLASIFYSSLAAPSAFGIAFLMLIAIIMHIKIGDPIKKSLPAFIFLSLSLIVALV
ncbi:DoxX family protein [Algibacter sp. L1A34]|uniref:DoxX family protein n=1 Tax=Algibacter sp. L1A34 TaxID=2686365 RepID=UPI00131AA477|nr:DoxX family protein [Algibacter sp. L1A34]